MSEADLMRMRQQQKLVSDLGISDIMKEAEGDLDVVKKKMEAQGFQAEDIKDVIAASDTRTTEQRSEEHLKAIRAKLVRDQAIVTPEVRDADGNIIQAEKSIDIMAQRNKVETAVIQTQKNYAASLDGTTQNMGKLSTAIQAVNVAAQPGKTILGIANKITAPIQAELAKITTFIKLPTGDLGDTAVRDEAAGGFISGPGTGTSDSIPARLSDGEYVINAAATKKYRPLLDKINKNPARMAAGGGPMMSTNKMEQLLSGILQAIKTSDFNYGSKQL